MRKHQHLLYLMHPVEVKSNSDCKRFVSLPNDLYKNQKQYIKPLYRDITDVFDPAVNKNLEHGNCVRWILLRDNKIIGRIAAFILRNTSTKGEAESFGGDGFFDLHTESYKDIIDGRGFGLNDARQSIDIVHDIRYAKIEPALEDYHPLVKHPLTKHPFNNVI